MGSSNGAQVHQWSDTDVETQLWNIEFNSSGCFKIISKQSNKVLDAGLDDSNNSRIHIWDDFDADNQLWYLEKPLSSCKNKPCKSTRKNNIKVLSKENNTVKKTNMSNKVKIVK